MGAKALRKRKYILERAREVFAAKGYKAVTMQDIVDACGISRGGLYLYYPGTRELFLAVLDEERPVDDDAAVEKALLGDASVADMLGLYLSDIINSILSESGTLSLAELEFFSSEGAGADPASHPLRRRFDGAAAQVAKLIALGVRTGEFECDDPEGAARNMLYALEGLRLMRSAAGAGREDMERELGYMLGRLTPVEGGKEQGI